MNPSRPFRLIGELMNNSFARARRAWIARDPGGYQKLAALQTGLGADFLTLNLDGTQSLQVSLDEMTGFLPRLIPAIQEATRTPISFDSPSVAFHREALRHYDRSRSPAPILNSVAASREDLDEMIDLAGRYDTHVIVMASEKVDGRGSAPCGSARDVHETARHFVRLLRERAGRSNERILVDPGLAPVGADTSGLVNMGLDAMRLIRKDPDLQGVHLLVGLSNVAFGMPDRARRALCNAYLTLGVEAGLDFVLGNPEHEPGLLDASDPTLRVVRAALEAGRPAEGEAVEMAGMRQAEKLMELI